MRLFWLLYIYVTHERIKHRIVSSSLFSPKTKNNNTNCFCVAFPRVPKRRLSLEGNQSINQSNPLFFYLPLFVSAFFPKVSPTLSLSLSLSVSRRHFDERVVERLSLSLSFSLDKPTRINTKNAHRRQKKWAARETAGKE